MKWVTLRSFYFEDSALVGLDTLREAGYNARVVKSAGWFGPWKLQVCESDGQNALGCLLDHYL